MRQLAVFFLLSASLTGCSSTLKPIPDCAIPAPMAEVGHPLTVPPMPIETRSDLESATYDLEGLLQLKRVREAGNTNFTVAKENAAALEARNEEVNALIECARYQNVWIQVHAEDLNDEQWAHLLTKIKYFVVIGAGIVVAIFR